MAYYARLNDENIVIDLIVADADHIASGGAGAEPQYFKEVEENTVGMNWHYVPKADVFYEPQPYPSWTLDGTYKWQPPVPLPSDGNHHIWDEENQSWTTQDDCCNGQK